MGENTILRFENNEVAQSFRVNPEKRTISGIAIPWGKIADNGFAKWRFASDSVRFDSTLISRIKLNLNHDRQQPIGVARRLQATSAGLDATFEIAEVPEGDRVLQLAKNNVLDGFSIEVDFRDGDSWVPDPADKSVRLVRSATLAGVALTAFPAFDDARVESVVAQRQAATVILNKETTSMAEENEENEEQMATEFERKRAIEFTRDMLKGNNEALAKMMEDNRNAMTSAFTAALEKLEMPQAARGTVRAARFALENEAPVYTFDGTGHSLVRDAWYASPQGGRDLEAINRVAKFRQQTDQVLRYAKTQWFATVTTGANGEIIPPGYRPDLYVGELSRDRPIINMVSRGQIENASPFTVPVFVSSTDATADHVEGVNPIDGTVVFTTRTVSPEAISGRLVLSREMVDASNPAIDQIALATMRESYARQTEAKAYTMINGVNGVGGSIVAGFVGSGAQADETTGDGNDLLLGIRNALARYPFNRFGPPTGAVMSQEATTALATAQSAEDGRFQLPTLGGQNVLGQGAPMGGWSIDGIPFVPAWSMTGNTSDDSDVIILNRADVWVWESPTLLFRYEERSGPALIELALFGYFGTHVLRPVGLSGLRHTAGG